MKLPAGSEGPEARAAAAELANLKKQINDLVAEMQNRRAPDGAQLVFKVLDETPDESAVETATSTRRHS